MREVLDLEKSASGEPGPHDMTEAEGLLGTSQRRLRAFTRPLGLPQRAMDAITRRVQLALRAIIRATREPPSATTPPPAEADGPHKFDLGLPREREVEPTIPWSYGQDRLTAMVVDPERLYTYWEVTDGAIERARAGLGPAGREAWLNLRVYDVTNRIFDGTNAHGYFDHRLERDDRQWFFHIGKPGSTACVELGLKSSEGYFVRIARSGRADFPESEAAPAGAVEWLTVRTATGAIEPPAPGVSVRPGERAAAQSPGTAAVGDERAWTVVEPGGAWSSHDEHGFSQHLFEGHWDWREIRREWRDGGRVLEWIGPVTSTTWEAGPFDVPVDAPDYREERHTGTASTQFRNGRSYVVHGPWRVVIRGLGARAERRVLAVWEVCRSSVASAGMEQRTVAAAGAPGRGGASETAGLGASERRWLAGSEERLGGASEIYRIGASELRYGGASEIWFVGASERLAAGASERVVRGASERRLGGASEWRAAGASERRGAGASERRLAGASESARPPRPPRE